MADIANAVFTGNPDTGGEPGADGIFKSLPNEVPGYPFDFSLVADRLATKDSAVPVVPVGDGPIQNSDDDEGADNYQDGEWYKGTDYLGTDLNDQLNGPT